MSIRPIKQSSQARPTMEGAGCICIVCSGLVKLNRLIRF